MIQPVSLGYLLNNAARLTRRDLTRRMHAQGLTFPQWLVLKDISYHENAASDELAMAAIARRLNSNRPNIMGMIDRLEKMDLVERRINPRDRRAHIITLTEKARTLVAELQNECRQTTDRALKGFSPEEEKTVKSLLARIIANLQQPGYYDYYLDAERRDLL